MELLARAPDPAPRACSTTVDGDLVGAFRALEAAGRLEIIGSAATHGFLPLLARDESIRFQLAVGAAEHRRLFGRAPVGAAGCRNAPTGRAGRGQPWPTAPRSRRPARHRGAPGRRRLPLLLRRLPTWPRAGRPLGLSGDPAALDPEVHQPAAPAGDRAAPRSPYQAYRVAHARGAGDVSAYVRDPRASMQVWSRFEGYPGDGAYLEFHKMRWPGGLKLWRVSGPSVDLGAKQPYDPGAGARPGARATPITSPGCSAGSPRPSRQRRDGVIVAPFDTELFGHWWFEGPDFLGGVYRALREPARASGRRTGSRHLAAAPSRTAIRMPTGSWGANGDFTHVAERADRLDLGAALAAGGALLGRGRRRRSPPRTPASSWRRPRASCCWRSRRTGSSSSRPARRRTTASAASGSTAAIPRSWWTRWLDGSPGALERGHRRAAELAERDALFPDVVPAIAAALGGSRSLVVG